MITIEQQPYGVTPVGQPLIFVASSTNVGNTGFRYRVVLVKISASEEVSFYLPPNPADKLVFDANAIVSKWCMNAVDLSGSPIVFADGSYEEVGASGLVQFKCNMYEAWIVDGVLTDAPSSEEITDIKVWPARYQISDGYRPNPATRYGLTGQTKYLLSSRYADTHLPDLFPKISSSGNVVYIPTREADYGVISFCTIQASGIAALKGRVTLVPDSGSPVTYTADLPDFGHFGCYPANLNASTISGIPKPSDYPNWRYIGFQILNASNAIVSASYVLYNAAIYGGIDCKYPNVRLAWVNEHGGWDFFNFTRKNEENLEVERRRYRKVVGTYAAETFGFNSFDRGLTERAPVVKQYLNIESGWLQEGEFTLLKSLLYSKQVFIVNDNATITPVLIEDNSYLVRRARDKKQYNQAMKLQYAHTINV